MKLSDVEIVFDFWGDSLNTRIKINDYVVNLVENMPCKSERFHYETMLENKVDLDELLDRLKRIKRINKTDFLLLVDEMW